MTWTWDVFTTFPNKLRASFVRPQLCSATFRRDLLFQLFNPYWYDIISAATSLQTTAQLYVACPVFCVLRDEQLSFDRRVCPFFVWPASSCCWLRLLYRCYTYNNHVITQRLLVGGGGGPGRSALWRVGVRLAHLLRHHRPHRRRSA